MDTLSSIRDASAADADLLSDLIREAFRDVAERFDLTLESCPKHPSNCTRHWIDADLARGVRYFILCQGGEPAGCVGVEHASADLCYLERLAVLPAKRGQGFGRRLALRAVEAAGKSGAGRIGIGIIAAQPELKAWYMRLGFAEIETKRFPHLPFAVCLMERCLGDATDRS